MPTISANSLDLSPARTRTNLSAPELIERALARGEGRFADNGALVVMTGDRTGRSPTDKWLEDTPAIHDKIWWGKVNQPITPEQFDTALRIATEHMNSLDEVFVFDGFAGADTDHRLGVRVVTQLAWHALFAETLKEGWLAEKVGLGMMKGMVETVRSGKKTEDEVLALATTKLAGVDRGADRRRAAPPHHGTDQTAALRPRRHANLARKPTAHLDRRARAALEGALGIRRRLLDALLHERGSGVHDGLAARLDRLPHIRVDRQDTGAVPRPPPPPPRL